MSQREQSQAELSMVSAAWSAVAVWDISAAPLTLVLFREVYDVLFEGVGSTVGRRAEDFAVDSRVGGTVVVDVWRGRTSRSGRLH